MTNKITIGPPGSKLDWDNWGKPVTDAINELFGSIDTWHSFPYANGWADNGGGFAAFKYRTVFNVVQLIGVAKSPNPFNSGIGTLPVGYRPLSTQPIWASVNTAGTDCLITVATNGLLTTFGSTNINTGWFINASFSLDL